MAHRKRHTLGELGRAAVAQIARVVGAVQRQRVPCFFTRFELARDGSDIGVYGRKRDLLDSEHWCLADSVGAELVPQLQPAAGDIVFVKKKPSGFHGTPLLGYGTRRRQDVPMTRTTHKLIAGQLYCSLAEAARALRTTTPKLKTIIAQEGIEYRNFRVNGRMWVSVRDLTDYMKRRDAQTDGGKTSSADGRPHEIDR